MSKGRISMQSKKASLSALKYYSDKLEKFYNRCKKKNLSEQEEGVLIEVFTEVRDAFDEINSLEIT